MPSKILIGIPAYNEAMTIRSVVEKTYQTLPDHDIIVVNDGSADNTAEIVRQSEATLVSLPCNLGYSMAVDTIIRYAYLKGYDAVAIIDADGQHDASYLPGFIQAFEEKQCDVLIGSRFFQNQTYSGNPTGRKLGMLVFSFLTKLLTGRRIYDTTSGMKAIGRKVMPALLEWNFVDYHAEAIIYLMNLGYTIDEYPITVEEREHGESMYSLFSSLWYPMKVLLMIVVSLLHSSIYRKKKVQKS